MRVLERVEKNNSLEVLVEAPEDLYYLSLIVERGDVVYGYTTRQLRIDREEGSEKGERVKVYMGVEVEKKSYHRFSNSLRLTGRVVDAPEYLHAKGSFHTLVVRVGDRVRIVKRRPLTSFEEELLRRAATNYRRVLLLSVGEDEVAVGVVSPIGIDVRGVARLSTSRRREEKSIRERVEPSLRKVLERIFEQYRLEDYETVVVAAPEHLKRILEDVMSRLGVKGRIRYVKVYEGGEAGIYELTRRDDMRSLFSEVRREFEQENIDELLARLARGDRKVAVGLEEAFRAAEWGAVKKLLLVDDALFDEELSDRVLTLLDNVYRHSGNIVLVPGNSEAGEKLKRMGKAVAELYFPLENQ